MEGYIWFHQQFFGGSKDEFEEYCSKHEEARLVMRYFAQSKGQLEKIAENLNNSNLLAASSDKN